MKFTLPLLLLFLLMACSENTHLSTGPKTDAPPATPSEPPEDTNYKDEDVDFTLMSIPLYSRVSPLLIDIDSSSFKRPVVEVNLYTSNDPCLGVPSRVLTGSEFTPGLKLTYSLNLNSQTLLSLKFNFEDDTESKCFILGEVTHDDVVPLSPVPPYSTLETGDVHIHIPFSIPDSDAKFVNIYRNGLLLKKVDAVLWRNGMGYFTIEEASSNFITFTVEDRAGNMSLQSSVVTVHQMSRDILPPEVTSTEGFSVNYGKLTTSPVITIAGNLAESSFEVDVFFAPNLHSPVGTYTSVEFSSGFNFTLAEDSLSIIMLRARDIYGNVSDFVTLSSYYVVDPIYHYMISGANEGDGYFVRTNSGEILIEVANRSYEEKSNLPIAITSITSSSPIITGGGTCLTGTLHESGSCSLAISPDLSVAGVINLSIPLSLDGAPTTLEIQLNVVSDLIATLSSTSKATLGNFVSAEDDFSFLYFENGITDSDLNVVSTNQVEAIIKSQMYPSIAGHIGIHDGALCLWNEETSTNSVMDATADLAEILAYSEEVGGITLIAMKDSSGNCHVGEYNNGSRVGTLSSLPGCLTATYQEEGIAIHNNSTHVLRMIGSRVYTFNQNVDGDVIPATNGLIASFGNDVHLVGISDVGLEVTETITSSTGILNGPLYESFITDTNALYVKGVNLGVYPGITSNNIFSKQGSSGNTELLIFTSSDLSFHSIGDQGNIIQSLDLLGALPAQFSNVFNYFSSKNYFYVFGELEGVKTIRGFLEEDLAYDLDISYSGSFLNTLKDGGKLTLFSSIGSGVSLSEYAVGDFAVEANEDFLTLNTPFKDQLEIESREGVGFYYVLSKSAGGYDLFKMRKINY